MPSRDVAVAVSQTRQAVGCIKTEQDGAHRVFDLDEVSGRVVPIVGEFAATRFHTSNVQFVPGDFNGGAVRVRDSGGAVQGNQTQTLSFQLFGIALTWQDSNKCRISAVMKC